MIFVLNYLQYNRAFLPSKAELASLGSIHCLQTAMPAVIGLFVIYKSPCSDVQNITKDQL